MTDYYVLAGLVSIAHNTHEGIQLFALPSELAKPPLPQVSAKNGKSSFTSNFTATNQAAENYGCQHPFSKTNVVSVAIPCTL